LLILVLVAAPVAALVKRPLAGSANAPTLRIRGGLGNIDPTMVAKVATGLLSASSALGELAASLPWACWRLRRPPRSPNPHLPFASRDAAQPCPLGMGQPLTAHAACPFQSTDRRLGDCSVWLLEYASHTLLRGAILAATTLAGSTLNNAVAWSNVPYTVFVLQGILQGRPAKHGVNAAGQYLILAISAFIMHTCFTVTPRPDDP
jgi:hypothetical protein